MPEAVIRNFCGDRFFGKRPIAGRSVNFGPEELGFYRNHIFLVIYVSSFDEESVMDTFLMCITKVISSLEELNRGATFQFRFPDFERGYNLKDDSFSFPQQEDKSLK